MGGAGTFSDTDGRDTPTPAPPKRCPEPVEGRGIVGFGNSGSSSMGSGNGTIWGTPLAGTHPGKNTGLTGDWSVEGAVGRIMMRSSETVFTVFIREEAYRRFVKKKETLYEKKVEYRRIIKK
jgi:hypothetical protein